jgi:predicted choloylglycine hydrolase
MTETMQKPYFTFTLEGTSYQIGQQQGKMLKEIPGWVEFFGSCKPDWSEQYYGDAETLYRRTCPGLNEEIQGLADTLHFSPQQLVYHFFTYLVPPHCSHFAALSDMTANGHTLVGRSYEFNIETNDNRFCLTRPQGKYAHMGTTSLLLGRLDGMNEHGLVVTMSAGGIPVGNVPDLRPPVQTGLQFWAVVRSLLENCKDVPEAVAWLKEIPCGGNPNLIFADASGRAARAEVWGAQKTIRQVEEGYLCATNHFNETEMLEHAGFVMANSPVRYELMQRFVEGKRQKLDVEGIRGFLSQPYPQGLCCHYYAETFGTMHSQIFDPQAREMQVCFGSPAVNDWHSYSFHDEAIPGEEFMVSFPQETAPASFWR